MSRILSGTQRMALTERHGVITHAHSCRRTRIGAVKVGNLGVVGTWPLIFFTEFLHVPNRSQTHASSTGVLQKIARVLREKASQDLERIMRGTSKTREKLGVVEELFTYWVLEDADQELEELEDALIVRYLLLFPPLRVLMNIHPCHRHRRCSHSLPHNQPTKQLNHCRWPTLDPELH